LNFRERGEGGAGIRGGSSKRGAPGPTSNGPFFTFLSTIPAAPKSVAFAAAAPLASVRGPYLAATFQGHIHISTTSAPCVGYAGCLSLLVASLPIPSLPSLPYPSLPFPFSSLPFPSLPLPTPKSKQLRLSRQARRRPPRRRRRQAGGVPRRLETRPARRGRSAPPPPAADE